MVPLKLLVLLVLVAAEAKHHFTGEVSLGFDDLDLDEGPATEERAEPVTEQPKREEPAGAPKEKKKEVPARVYPMWEKTASSTTEATTAEAATVPRQTTTVEVLSGESDILPSSGQGGFPSGGGSLSFGGGGGGRGGGGFGGGHAPVFPSDDVPMGDSGWNTPIEPEAIEETTTISQEDEARRQEERRRRREERKNKKEKLLRERGRIQTERPTEETLGTVTVATTTATESTTTASPTTEAATVETTTAEMTRVEERRKERRHRRLEEQRRKKEALRKERQRLRMERERLLREEEDRLEEMRKQTLRHKQLELKRQLEEREDVRSGDVDEIKKRELEDLADERRKEEEELKRMEEEARQLAAELAERERDMETRDQTRREEAERIRRQEDEQRRKEEEEERRRRTEEEEARLEAQRKVVEEERRQVEDATKVLEEARKKLKEETEEDEREERRQKKEELARLERKRARLERLRIDRERRDSQGGETARMYSPEMYKEKLLREKQRLEEQLRSIEKHVGDEGNIEIEVEKVHKSRIHGIRTAQEGIRKVGDVEKQQPESVVAYSKESFNRFQGHEGGRKDRKKPSPVRRRIITTSAAPVTVEATTAVLPGTTSIQEYATSSVTEPVRIVEYQPIHPSFSPLSINPIPSAVVMPQLAIQPIQPLQQPVQVFPEVMLAQPVEKPRSVEEYLKAYYDEYYKEWYRTHNQSPPTDASSGFLGVIPASHVGAPPPSLPVAQIITNTAPETPQIVPTSQPDEMSKKQLDSICASIKSATKAFGIKKPGEYAKTHCNYIQTFYPQVTCEQMSRVIDYCAPMLNS